MSLAPIMSAVVSTGVPTIAIGWNPKYDDLMSEYGVSECLLDVNIPGPQQAFQRNVVGGFPDSCLACTGQYDDFDIVASMTFLDSLNP